MPGRVIRALTAASGGRRRPSYPVWVPYLCGDRISDRESADLLHPSG